MSSIDITKNFGYADHYLCLCDNCGEVLDSSELASIKDAEIRLTPGTETPAGECPHCYALAFVLTADQARDRGIDANKVARQPND